MRNVRIVFMGTPDFAVETLRILVEEGYTIAGVITAPDRPAGRGRKLQQPAVKTYALSQGLKVLQPVNLKDAGFIETLRSLEANLQVVVAFRMLPEVVWAMPEYGTFNLHASLLPDYRGAAPINRAIINGERTTGVTTFFIDAQIDTGELLLQQPVEIGAAETAGELHDRLMREGADLVLKTVRGIERNELRPTPQQDEKALTPAPKIDKATCRVQWNEDVDTVYNFIRGLSPYPTAWTEILTNGEALAVKLYGAKKEKTGHSYEPGRVIADKKDLKIAVRDGFLHITELQLPGKRRMSSEAVLNGFEFGANAKAL